MQEQEKPVEKPSSSDSVAATQDPIPAVSASTESRGELRGATLENPIATSDGQ